MGDTTTASVAASGVTTYFLVFNSEGKVWNGSTTQFESYSSADYGNYALTGISELGSSALYSVTIPSAIPEDILLVFVREQIGGSPAEDDPDRWYERVYWSGSGITQPGDPSGGGVDVQVETEDISGLES